MNSDKQQATSIFDEEDERILKSLDVENYNNKSIYNVPGFRPIHTEIRHAPVSVTGTLPKDLEGVYLRNGTNAQFSPASARFHMFDGAGMLHQVQIKDGEASYSNSYIRTPRFEFERQAGREVYTSFSDMATAGPLFLEKMASVEKKKLAGRIPNLGALESSQSSTAVQFHHGNIYCLNEAGYPFVLNTQTRQDGRLVIDGSGYFETWGGNLKGPFSAHPRVSPDTGDLYSIGVDVAGKLIVSHVKNGELANFQSFEQDAPDGKSMGYCHDYFLTGNYLVFPDISMRFSQETLVGPEKSFWKFDPDYKVRWGVLPRSYKPGDKPRWFVTGHAGSLWHVVNAWEEHRADGGTDLVLVAPMFETYPPDMPIHTPQEPHAKLHKWVLNLDTGAVTQSRRLLEHGYERPSLNLDFVGEKSRYGYLLDEERDGYMGKGVLKYDLLAECEVKYFDYGDYYGGEALFVPKTNSTAEDDGYLLDLLMTDDDACLVVIDASKMEEVARLHLPQRVPFGVHACWLDQVKLAALPG